MTLQMEAIYNDSKRHDVWFQLDDGTTFGGHRLVLANCESSWFQRMTEGDFKEAGQATVHVPEVRKEVFELALRTAYRVVVISKCDRNFVEMGLEAASKFELPRLAVDILNDIQNSNGDLQCCFVEHALKYGSEFDVLTKKIELQVPHIIR